MAKKNNDIPAEEYSISYRKAIREKIEKEIAEFLLNGGQIKQVTNEFTLFLDGSNEAQISNSVD